MSSFTTKLDLPLITTGAGDNLALHNRGMRRLDAIVTGNVRTRQLNTPPGSLVAGDCYIVAVSGLSSWLAKDNYIALWTGTVWEFFEPQLGMRMWIEDESVLVTCVNGVNWRASNGPAVFAAEKNTTQVVSTVVGTWLNIEWNTQLNNINDSATYEHDTSINQEQIVIREAGLYEVHCNLSFAASGTAVNVLLDAELQVGTIGSPSSITGSTSHVVVNPTGFTQGTITVTAVVNLAINQEIRVRCTRQTTSASTTIDLQAHSRILVRRL